MHGLPLCCKTPESCAPSNRPGGCLPPCVVRKLPCEHRRWTIMHHGIDGPHGYVSSQVPTNSHASNEHRCQRWKKTHRTQTTQCESLAGVTPTDTRRGEPLHSSAHVSRGSCPGGFSRSVFDRLHFSRIGSCIQRASLKDKSVHQVAQRALVVLQLQPALPRKCVQVLTRPQYGSNGTLTNLRLLSTPETQHH